MPKLPLRLAAKSERIAMYLRPDVEIEAEILAYHRNTPRGQSDLRTMLIAGYRALVGGVAPPNALRLDGVSSHKVGVAPEPEQLSPAAPPQPAKSQNPALAQRFSALVGGDDQ
jgi:hypothetical protein